MRLLNWDGIVWDSLAHAGSPSAVIENERNLQREMKRAETMILF